MSRTAWEFLFLVVILKIPMIYLGLVVWYAIKAESQPGQAPEEHSVWRPWANTRGPRPRRGGPHGTRDGLRRSRSARRDRVAS